MFYSGLNTVSRWEMSSAADKDEVWPRAITFGTVLWAMDEARHRIIRRVVQVINVSWHRVKAMNEGWHRVTSYRRILAAC
jgi:hypothetical protein